jgi:hypothetical protein
MCNAERRPQASKPTGTPPALLTGRADDVFSCDCDATAAYEVVFQQTTRAQCTRAPTPRPCANRVIWSYDGALAWSLPGSPFVAIFSKSSRYALILFANKGNPPNETGGVDAAALPLLWIQNGVSSDPTAIRQALARRCQRAEIAGDPWTLKASRSFISFHRRFTWSLCLKIAAD